MSAAKEPSTALVHFYRAVVAHADVWRQRMDATTNWAAATTAAMITFAFTNPQVPHFVLLLALVFDTVFLLMEARRYQTYDIWRRQFRLLHRNLVLPALLGDDGGVPEEETRAGLRQIAAELGSTVPRIRLVDALGYRIRRNYGYLFAVGVVAWVLKLQVHPQPSGSAGEMIDRARVGLIGPDYVFGAVVALSLIGLVMALRAPSERMSDWAPAPSPWMRVRSRSRTRSGDRPARADHEGGASGAGDSGLFDRPDPPGPA